MVQGQGHEGQGHKGQRSRSKCNMSIFNVTFQGQGCKGQSQRLRGSKVVGRGRLLACLSVTGNICNGDGQLVHGNCPTSLPFLQHHLEQEKLKLRGLL